MSQQKIVDYKILKVLTRKYKSEQQQKIKKCSSNANAPNKNIILIPPQQPEDNIQNDQTIAVEELKQFNDSVPNSNDASRINQAYLNVKNSFDFSFYNDQICQRINTDVQNNDISKYLLSSMKFFKWNNQNNQKGNLVNKLLSEKKKGIKFVSSFNSTFVFDFWSYLYFIKYATNISILFINCLFSIIFSNTINTSIQVIQVIALLLILFNLFIQLKKMNTFSKLDKKKEKLQFIFYIIQLLFQIVLIIISKFNKFDDYQALILLLQNFITIIIIFKIEIDIKIKRIYQLIIITLLEFHIFSCIFILLEFKTDFQDMDGEQKFLCYLQQFKRFVGYSLGLGNENGEQEQNIQQYLFILWVWTVLFLLKNLFYLELYLLANKIKESQKNQQDLFKILKYFQTLQFSKKQLNKIENQIQMQQQQQKRMIKFKIQEQLMHHYFNMNEDLFLRKQQLQILPYIKNIKFLQQFSEQSQKQLQNITETIFYKNNDYIMQQNQLDDCSFYIIKSGNVEICFQNQNNNKQQLQILGNNDYFGQVSFITGIPRSATIISQGDSCLLKISRNNFIDIINKNDHDRELINKISLEILNQNHYDQLDLKCFNCQCDTHLIQFCPQLHLNIQKEKIIFNLLVHQEQRRHQYKRLKTIKSNCKLNFLENQAKCLEFQEDQGFASSLGDTDHTNYLQNQSHNTVTQSSINYPSKIMNSQKLQVKNSNIDNIQNFDLQEILKEQQFKEIDQIFVRTAQQKATTSTAGFGYRESSSLKSKNYENVNDTIEEQGSEESSLINSEYSDDQVSAASMQIQQKPMKSSTQRSDKFSQHRSRVSSISMNYTPKHSQVSIQNTFTLKSDLNNNVIQSGSNNSSQKNISPLHLKEERQNTLTVPSGNNITKNPSKRSMMNPFSQLNYELSPFVAFMQNMQTDWNSIEIDKQRNYQIYFPEFNVDKIIINYNNWLKKEVELSKQLKLDNNMNKIQKYNTL